MYVDYNVDIVYMEDLGTTNMFMAPFLGRVQHLAYELSLHRGFWQWAMIKRDCPILKSLTFIDHPTVPGSMHEEEWRLVDIPADFDPEITLPQVDEHRHHFEEQIAKVIDKHGNLALFSAEPQETLRLSEKLQKHVRDLAEWKIPSLKIAIVARRKKVSLSWVLNYPVWEVIPNIQKVVHWQKEPVLLGDGAITSCRPDPHPNLHSGYCGKKRWFLSNDAFWLSKDERAEV